ncbi:MAG: transcriptional repressor [Oscillibacter sp.]|nr:transcriptional repressor [Oscillibacter sp.]
MQQRFSYQREQIYAALQQTTEHPTAEMIYARLKPEMPRLSLGTVYRNLRQLAQDGQVTELSGPVARFDPVTRPHTHFCCTRCGAVSDLDIPYDGSLDQIAAGDGRHVRQHSLTFYGLCPACANENKSNSK